jgi:hypothetical protein
LVYIIRLHYKARCKKHKNLSDDVILTACVTSSDCVTLSDGVSLSVVVTSIDCAASSGGVTISDDVILSDFKHK